MLDYGSIILCVGLGWGERQTDRHTDRQRQTGRLIDRDRQTDRQTEGRMKQTKGEIHISVECRWAIERDYEIAEQNKKQ